MAAEKSKKKHPLARWRALRGLTQRQLADEADVHLTTIARIESAGQIPAVDVAIRIAAVLSQLLPVRVEWIWGDVEEVELRLNAAEETAEHGPLYSPKDLLESYKAGFREAAEEIRAVTGLQPTKPKQPRG